MLGLSLWEGRLPGQKTIENEDKAAMGSYRPESNFGTSDTVRGWRRGSDDQEPVYEWQTAGWTRVYRVGQFVSRPSPGRGIRRVAGRQKTGVSETFLSLQIKYPPPTSVGGEAFSSYRKSV